MISYQMWSHQYDKKPEEELSTLGELVLYNEDGLIVTSKIHKQVNQ